jgi:hypothetical protein
MHRIEIEVVSHNARGPIYRVAYAGEVLIDRDPGAGVRRRVGTYAYGHHRQAGGLAIGQCLPGDDYGHRDLLTIDSAMPQRARHARGTDVPVRGACRRPFPVTWGTATGKRLGQDAGNAISRTQP